MNELKSLPIWVCWCRGPNNGKIPKNPHTGGNAQCNAPKTWATYEQALAAAQKHQFEGIGFMLTDGISGIDIDNIQSDPESQKLAQEIINHMDTYVEYSPSGNGYHIIFKCDPEKIPRANNKLAPTYYQKNPHNGIECYISGLTNRFFTYTGKIVNNGGLEDRTEQLLTFLDRHMIKQNPPSPSKVTRGYGNTHAPTAHDVIIKARKAKNGKKFIALFEDGNISNYNGDESSADIALCCILAFWCGNNSDLIDEVFRLSALYREKWNRADYRASTIKAAVLRLNNFYNWGKSVESRDESASVKNARYVGAVYLNPFESAESKQRYGLNDIGAGNLFADVYKNISRFVPEMKLWYVYDGRAWRPDEGNIKVAEQAKYLVNYLLDCRKYISNDDELKAWLKFVHGLMRKKARDTMLHDAASVFPVSILDFDKNPYLFNCCNYTLNLQTFKAHKHRPADLLSKVSQVAFDASAKCDRWEKFINEIMCGDEEKAKFLQKALGYALIGEISFECFFILYGNTTRNGKGSTMETILHLMGDYGKTAQPETIAKKQINNSAAPSEDIARLKGARFVNISEPDKGLMLNAALVKQLTGGDTVTARFLHQNSFEYRPEYKLFINTNHLPHVFDDSIFASGRVKLIPFERHFTESEQDKGLKAFFKAPKSLSGILNWLIEGLKLLKFEGLELPTSIVSAIKQYREESDIIGLFISEMICESIGRKTTMSEIHGIYKSWCDEYGYVPMSNRNLINEFRRKNMEIKRSNGNKSYLFDYGLACGGFDEPVDEFMNAIFDFSCSDNPGLDLSEFD